MMIKVNPFKIKSLLFVPAIREDFLKKVLDLEGDEKPDAIIFDLEDSVHENSKIKARELLGRYLIEDKLYRDKIFRKYVVMIRVNDSRTKWFDEDMRLVNLCLPNFLVVPKLESARELSQVRKKSKAEQLLILIETLLGFENSKSIVKSLNGFDILSLGYEDLSSELLIERPERLQVINPLSLIISYLIILARKEKIAIIDSVSRKFKGKSELKNFREECSFTSGMGLTGKLAINPSQVPIINKIFDKTHLVKNAREKIKNFEKLGRDSFVLLNEKGEMLDNPSYKMYKKIMKIFGDE